MKPITSIKELGEGVSFYKFYGKGNINNKLYHIRGVVDDYFIVRRWLKHKQYWFYECIWFYSIELDIKHGVLFRGLKNHGKRS